MIERLKLGPWPGVNVWLVSDDDGLTVVDTGYFWHGPALIRAVAGRRVARILLTHFHPDHSGGAAALSRDCGAPVYVHRLDLPYVLGTARLDQHPGWWVTRLCLRALRLCRVDRTAPPTHVIPFEEGDRLGRWQVLHTPGHTPGSSSFWDPATGLLFCGDNLVNLGGVKVGVPWWTLDHAQQRRSVARYKGLDVRQLLSGHGPPAAL